MQIVIVMTTMDYLDITKSCLESLRQCTKVPYSLIIVDASKDDSTINYVQRDFPDARILELDRPYWIAYAWNRGLELALEEEPEAICLLNNDIIFTDYWLGYLANTFYADTLWPVGLVGPLTLRPSGKQQSPFPRPAKTSIYPCRQIMGACLLLSTEMINDVGFFNEQFINNHDEIQYCSRVWAHKYMVMANMRSKIIHLCGTVRQATDVTVKWQDVCKEYNLNVPHPDEMWEQFCKLPIAREGHDNYMTAERWWDLRWE